MFLRHATRPKRLWLVDTQVPTDTFTKPRGPRIRFEGNVASELDVRQAETALYSAQAQIPQLDIQIAQQEDAISILAGRNPGSVTRGAPITAQNSRGGVSTQTKKVVIQ